MREQFSKIRSAESSPMATELISENIEENLEFTTKDSLRYYYTLKRCLNYGQRGTILRIYQKRLDHTVQNAKVTRK